MQDDTNRHVLVALLKACGQRKDLRRGSKLHAHIAKHCVLEEDVHTGSSLISMYAKCGSIAKARDVFDNLRVRNIVAWNALISGYAQHGYDQEALNCFQLMQLEGIAPNVASWNSVIAGYAQHGHGWKSLDCLDSMQLEGLSPDAVTFASLLKACGSIGAADMGRELHVKIVNEGLVNKDIIVGNALIDMYAKCGLLAKAQEVCAKLPVRNTVSWSALIAGYAQHGRGEEALNCFVRMQLEGISPDAITFVSILKACSSIGAVDKGQELHTRIRAGLLEKHTVVGTALVDMYARCGLFAKAQEVFDKLPAQDVVLWSALIAGYAQYGRSEESLSCFEQMQLEGISPNAVTFVCVLKACSNIRAIHKGQEVHAKIAKEKSTERNVFVGTALVDMYAKCGLLARAQEVFDKLQVRNVVLWNTLITGYASLGKAEHVFFSFDKMTREGSKPDLVTFTSLLNVCSHAGLLDKGQMYFEKMRSAYGVVPTLEHHICLIDLFGRAGFLDKAIAVIKEMPLAANLDLWHAVLGACRKWGNAEIARLAFEHSIQLDEKDGAAYVCMRNVYMDAGRQEDAEEVEAMRVRKHSGRCRTDASRLMCSFSPRD